MSELTKDNWPLVDPHDDGIRPAGDPDACFYCSQKIGQPHARDCLVVTKVVRFRCTVDVDITVPHHWSSKKIAAIQATRGFGEVWEKLFNYSTDDDCLEGVYLGVCELVGTVDETPRREIKRESDQ